jgi:hypothetical protein
MNIMSKKNQKTEASLQMCHVPSSSGIHLEVHLVNVNLKEKL